MECGHKQEVKKKCQHFKLNEETSMTPKAKPETQVKVIPSTAEVRDYTIREKHKISESLLSSET